MLVDKNKCKLCRGKMSKPKPVLDGPNKGQTRIICMNCGYIVYLAQVFGEESEPEQSQQHAPKPNPVQKPHSGRWELS